MYIWTQAQRSLRDHFILGTNSNFGRISHVFEILPLKSRKILVLPSPPWFDALAGVTPFKFVMKFGIRKLESWGYHTLAKKVAYVAKLNVAFWLMYCDVAYMAT